MTLFTGSGSLPQHQYVWVDRSFIRKDGQGFEPAVWFGVQSKPARMWGCHVMLECGAIYRNVPAHALAFSEQGAPQWETYEAQMWDCYSYAFSLHRYDYLTDLYAEIDIHGEKEHGWYLFTAIPLFDGFTEAPDQGKEFMFMRTEHDRLTIQPTNKILFLELSFTAEKFDWPSDVKRQTSVYSCEVR